MRKELDDQLVLAKVIENIGQYFPDSRPLKLKNIVEIIGPSFFQNSRIYRINLKGDSSAIIVKVMNDLTCHAQSQFDALHRVWPWFSRNEFDLNVPKPLDIFPKYNAVVMEAVQGMNLAYLIVQTSWPIMGRRKRPSTVQAMVRAACWLRRFHGVGSIDISEENGHELIVQKIHQQLDQCQIILSKELRDGALKAIQDALALVEPKEDARAWLHGDYKIDNILVTDNCLTALDFGMQSAGNVYYDLASFCNSIDLVRIAHKQCLVSRKFLEELKEVFLAKYFEHNGSVDVHTLCTFQLMGMIQKCLYFTNKYRHQKLVILYLRKFFTRWFNQLMKKRTDLG